MSPKFRTPAPSCHCRSEGQRSRPPQHANAQRRWVRSERGARLAVVSRLSPFASMTRWVCKSAPRGTGCLDSRLFIRICFKMPLQRYNRCRPACSVQPRVRRVYGSGGEAAAVPARVPLGAGRLRAGPGGSLRLRTAGLGSVELWTEHVHVHVDKLSLQLHLHSAFSEILNYTRRRTFRHKKM